MRLKQFLVAIATLSLFCAPAMAGSFGVFGSYWDSSDASNSWGGGARVGFGFVKFLELEIKGTYYPSFTLTESGQSVDFKATPVDGGLRFNILPEKSINPYVGAGATYYFLNTSDGSADNKTGWYGEGGVEFGKKTHIFVEAVWRKMDTTLSFNSFDTNVTFDGWSGDVGFNWSWGK